jgi:hypothetical protein
MGSDLWEGSGNGIRSVRLTLHHGSLNAAKVPTPVLRRQATGLEDQAMNDGEANAKSPSIHPSCHLVILSVPTSCPLRHPRSGDQNRQWGQWGRV